jgi:hypothetical protein
MRAFAWRSSKTRIAKPSWQSGREYQLTMAENLTHASARTKKFRRNALEWLGPGALVALLFVAAPVSVRAEDATLINPDEMKWVPLDAVLGTDTLLRLRVRHPRPARTP